MRPIILNILASMLVVMGVTITTNTMAAQRRFVSGSGSDANPCSLTSPCRTLQAAVDAVDPGGEVVPLDSAGYGDLYITKGVTVSTPPGIIASITVSSGDAVTVNAADADIVILRGLSITGLHSGLYGIFYQSGGTLIVEGVTVTGFVHYGLYAHAATPSSVLVIRQSTFTDNDDYGMRLRAEPTEDASLTAAVSEVFLTSNGLAGLTIDQTSNVTVTVKNSVATGNGGTGFSNQSSNPRLYIESCVATGNAVGVDGMVGAESDGNVWLSNSTVTANATGIGTGVLTRKNNTVEGNGIDGTFAGAFGAK